MGGPLQGRRIVVPESRELDLFARMLEEQGATTLRCPMVRIIDLDDPAPVQAWLRRLVDGRMDDLVLLTGEGLRRLLTIARAAALESDVIAAVGRVRTVTRGPKPARALREIGLAPNLAAMTPTTEGVIETLGEHKLHGRRVGVQLYPGNPNAMLLDFLRHAGAAPDPVLPYQYASDAESSQVETAIKEMAAGRIDVVAFTSAPQLRRLREVARSRGLENELAQGMHLTRMAAVGPVVAAAIEAMGVPVAIAPVSAFHMKPLVSAICAAFATPGPAKP
jgi:uroporphyrinogen-III synthase